MRSPTSSLIVFVIIYNLRATLEHLPLNDMILLLNLVQDFNCFGGISLRCLQVARFSIFYKL